MTQQWLDYYSGSHHTVVLLFLANMPRQIAWCKWFTWNKGLSHCTCGVATITRANRNQQTWGSKTKPLTETFPEISQLSRQTDVFLHKRVKITQIRQGKTAPRLLLLVRKHLRGLCFFDIPMNGEIRTEKFNSESKQGYVDQAGESTFGKLHGRVGKGGKIFTVHKKEKFPRISNFIPLRYGPKQLAESRPGRWSNS